MSLKSPLAFNAAQRKLIEKLSAEGATTRDIAIKLGVHWREVDSYWQLLQLDPGTKLHLTGAGTRGGW